MDRRPAVEGVGRVCVAEPVWGDGEVDAGAARRLAHDAQHGHRLQRSAVLAGAEDGKGVFGVAAERCQKLGDRFGNLDSSGLGALAPDGYLGTVAVGLNVAPAKAADLADAHAG